VKKLLLAVIVAGIVATPAWAGSPHFINSAFSLTSSGNTLTVSGKEAGLGDETQIHVVLTATAECINGGGNHPKASNKTSVSAEDDFPVQNGKADFTLSATAVFDPYPAGACGTVRFSDVTVTDTTNGLTHSF
jgi:hypothetical protein